MAKKFYRVKEGKILCGVCTGVAKYFDLDLTLVRVLWAAFTLFGGMGITLYILFALLAPEEPYDAGQSGEENKPEQG